MLMDVESADRAEAVEGAGSGGGVSTHTLKDQPFSNFEFGKKDFLGDEIERVASGSEDVGEVVGGFSVVGRQGDGHGVLVVEEDAVERAIDSVVDVVANHLSASVDIVRDTARVNVGDEGHSGGGEVASRFSNDSDVRREKLVQEGGDDLGDLGEGWVMLVGSRESSSNIQEGEVETIGGAEVEDRLRQNKSVTESRGVIASTADVETKRKKKLGTKLASKSLVISYLIPMTFKLRAAASARSSGQTAAAAPNLVPNLQRE